MRYLKTHSFALILDCEKSTEQNRVSELTCSWSGSPVMSEPAADSDNETAGGTRRSGRQRRKSGQKSGRTGAESNPPSPAASVASSSATDIDMATSSGGGPDSASSSSGGAEWKRLIEELRDHKHSQVNARLSTQLSSKYLFSNSGLSGFYQPRSG